MSLASVEQYIPGNSLHFEYTRIVPGNHRIERASAFLCHAITEEITGLPVAEDDPGAKLTFGLLWNAGAESEILRLSVTAPHNLPLLGATILKGELRGALHEAFRGDQLGDVGDLSFGAEQETAGLYTWQAEAVAVPGTFGTLSDLHFLIEKGLADRPS